MNQNTQESAEEIILKVMQHFGFRHQYQVAEYFSVTAQTLSGWIKSNTIPPKHLVKYQQEIHSNVGNNRDLNERSKQNIESIPFKKISISSLNKLLYSNILTIIITPIILTSFVLSYVLYIAPKVYTSTAKVLPISDKASPYAGLGGIAAQFGLNMPSFIRGSIQWNELYPDIISSENLLRIIIKKSFKTEKFQMDKTLIEILHSENNYHFENEEEKIKMAIEDLRKMINVQKGRLSPVVSIIVNAHEPQLAQDLASTVIKESGIILLDLKTQKINEKRIFIEERIKEVHLALSVAERAEEKFRQVNKSIIQSPSLSLELRRLSREVELQSSLYISLKSQHENAKIEEVQQAAMLQVIDGPIKPLRLTSPKVGRSVLLSLFIGFTISFFIIYSKEYIFEN